MFRHHRETSQRDITENILKEVKNWWGDDYFIVTIDGLKLEESEGTKGMDCLVYICE